MATLRLQNADDPRLELFTSLTNHQLRSSFEAEGGILIAESQIAIRVALAHGVEPLAFLLDERRLESMADVLQEAPDDVPIFVLPPKEAERLTGYRVTRGALCAMRRPQLPSVQELAHESKRLVVIEGLTDTSNVGAVFRNAAALGADGVIVAPSCADPLSRRAVRVSMGNVFLVPWASAGVDWHDGVFESLKEEGYTSVALALEDGALPLDEMSLQLHGKVALFFGSEGNGLTRRVIAQCDHTAIIPMAHGVDSLNVAASTAVALWECFGRA